MLYSFNTDRVNFIPFTSSDYREERMRCLGTKISGAKLSRAMSPGRLKFVQSGGAQYIWVLSMKLALCNPWDA